MYAKMQTKKRRDLQSRPNHQKEDGGAVQLENQL